MKSAKFDVFGRLIAVTRSEDAWAAFYLGSDGTRRAAADIVIPADVPEAGIEQYLGDLCHEWASERHQHVKRLD